MESCSRWYDTKIQNCVDAVENGVRGVVILDGRKPHSILHEIFSDKGSGTLIRNERFIKIKFWLFDLDNTLYDGATKVFDQVDKKMSKFISEKLNVSLLAKNTKAIFRNITLL